MTRTEFYDTRKPMLSSALGSGHIQVHEDETGIREAVGLFMNAEDLQAAIRDLEGTEFPRHDISVLARPGEVQEIFGHSSVPSNIAEDLADTPRQAPVRPEEKTIGASALIGGTAYIGVIAMALAAGPLSVPATIAAIAIGGGSGAVIGGGIAKLLEEHYAKAIHDQVAEGGLLLWVRTPDSEREQIAMDVLTKHGAAHVKIHEIV